MSEVTSPDLDYDFIASMYCWKHGGVLAKLKVMTFIQKGLNRVMKVVFHLSPGQMQIWL